MCVLDSSTLLTKMLVVELKDQDGILVESSDVQLQLVLPLNLNLQEGDILYTHIVFNRSVPVQDQLA